MLNHIDVMGRLTRDPEKRQTQGGTSVATFTLAVERDFNHDEVDFIDVVVWRGGADFVSKWFHKGDAAAVSGRLQIREWTDNNGIKRRTSEIVADNVYFAEKKKADKDDFELDDSDLPF